jgi:hypothetical protein
MTDIEAILGLVKILVELEGRISDFIKGVKDEDLRRKLEEAVKDRDVDGLNDLLGLSHDGQA